MKEMKEKMDPKMKEMKEIKDKMAQKFRSFF